jgi:hypothetical protein
VGHGSTGIRNIHGWVSLLYRTEYSKYLYMLVDPGQVSSSAIAGR